MSLRPTPSMRPAALLQLCLCAAMLAGAQCSGDLAGDPAGNPASGPTSGQVGEPGDRGLTAFELELARIDEQLSDLRGGASPLDNGVSERSLKVHLLYLRAAHTMARADVEAVRTTISDGLATTGYSEDLYLVRAQLDLKFHLLDRAEESLRMLSHRVDSPLVIGLRADLALQRGRLEDAEMLAKKAQELLPGWSNLARLAHLGYQRGEIQQAESFYLAAQNEITAKEMRAYAWIELQRGLLDFHSGGPSEALAHYRRAERAYSGWWLIEEHIAEALGAIGRHSQAIELYEAVIARTSKPDLMHALGDVLRRMGEPERAREWHVRALSGYLASVERGEVHYLHHLASYYGDVEADGAGAVKWAREDFQLRPNADSQATLAWALFQNGRLAEARTLMGQALDRGSSSPELLARSKEVLGERY